MLTPIRGLGNDGVLTDIDPFASTTTQFSFAANARFENGVISRGPISATVGTIAASTPRFLVSYKTLGNVATFDVCTRDGRVINWVPPGTPGGAGAETDWSIAGYVANNDDEAYTGTSINDIIYINRPDRVPWFKIKGGTTYTPITTGSDWGATWRAQSFRSIAGVCVAINVTKAGVNYPTTVLNSDYMVFDTIPALWTPSTTNSANSTTIADLQEPLVDGWPHRDRLILYTENECWLMEPRYDQLMFNFRRLFTNAGVISQNCVAEWNNTHFVFGSTDIWVHDGYSRQSLAFGSVRDFIYNNILRDYRYLFFTAHQPRNNEIMFCYVSNDPYCAFPVGGNIGYPGCNRAAVYNYLSKTWYFYDLPYVTSAGLGIATTGLTYTSSDPITYDSLIGSYGSFSDTSRVALLTVGAAVTGSPRGTLAAAMRSFEKPDSGSVNGILDTVATAPVQLRNDLISTDDWGVSVRDYKYVKAIYPQASIVSGASPLMFDWGSGDYASTPPPTFGDAQSYDGATNYKLDYRMAGRFLSFSMTYDDWRDFKLSGFDVDWVRTGQR